MEYPKEPSIESSAQSPPEVIDALREFQIDSDTLTESSSVCDLPTEGAMEFENRSQSEEPASKVQSARKGTGGKSKNDEEIRLAKIQRTYEQLSFSKPGKLFADFGISDRGKRRETVERKVEKIRPHYDAKGHFIHPDVEEPIKICDCLSQDCEGCFPPCDKCSSRMCGPICRVNRNMIPMSITENGAGGLVIKNPLVSEKRKKQTDCEEVDEDASYSDSDESGDSDDDPGF